MESRGGKTIAAKASFSSPFKMAKPFYREGYTEFMPMYIGPGLCAGDHSEVRVHAREGARALFTQQSFLKIHPSEANPSSQALMIRVDGSSALAWLENPIIPFRGANAFLKTQVHLEPGARFFFCSAFLSGRAAMGEAFCFSRLESSLEVFVGGRRALLDRQEYSPGTEDLSGIGRFEGYGLVGMAYAYGYEPIVSGQAGAEWAMTKAREGMYIPVLARSGEAFLGLAKQAAASIFL